MEVGGHKIARCGRWLASSIELNTYMNRVKHFICAGVVMAQDQCPLVNVSW